ncbi:MAG: hypothetical protein FWF75_06440 [Propionibacteriaceae bacterium]|nr:hypothetical protein [Propionibacteriaceae bacterium]
MHIDWIALLVVASVTLAVTVALVALVSTGALCLTLAHNREQAGRPVIALRTGAIAAFAVVGLAALFGLWLLIPYLH